MKKILVVDDHIGILRVLSDELESCGYKVSTAINGREALNKIEKECFDLVILDIVMPEMNGFEMLARLREYSGLPVLVHSFDECNKDTAMKLGANSFILKPFDISMILKEINRQVSR